MQSPNTSTWRAVLLLVAVLVEGLGVQMVSSYSSCVRPMAELDCDPETERTSDIDDKIAGGHIAEPGSTPWLVSLMDANYEDPVPFCGGTLISHSWVITSASCVSGYQKNLESIKVVLGEYDLTVHEGWEKNRGVNYIALHPEYEIYSHNADVALMRLCFYVFYSQRIGTLQLPSWWDAMTNEASDGTDQTSTPTSNPSSTRSTSPSSTSPTAGLSGSNNASLSTSPSAGTNDSPTTYRGNPTLDKILMGALAVQVLGTAVMAVIVTVVIRRASRVTTIVCLDTDEEQQDSMSAAAAAAAANHPREHD